MGNQQGKKEGEAGLAATEASRLPSVQSTQDADSSPSAGTTQGADDTPSVQNTQGDEAPILSSTLISEGETAPELKNVSESEVQLVSEAESQSLSEAQTLSKSESNPAAVSSASLTHIESGGATVMLKNGVTHFYRKYRKVEPEQVSRYRDIEITMQNFRYAARVPMDNRIETNNQNKYTAKLQVGGKSQREEQVILDDLNLRFRSGEVTLILGTPGSGRSTLLKALAGKLEVTDGSTSVSGQVLFNGLPIEQVDKLRTVALVDQTDAHIPVLTVRETFTFAADCQRGKASKEKGKDSQEEYEKLSQKQVDLTLRLLGLDSCADTIVGNAAIRGVSGGQRRRVTTGEVLVSGVSVFLGDEISTGLDSSATFDIVSSLRSWAKAMHGTVVLALLQPQPEVVALFDQIICLDQGKVVASGTAEQVEEYYQMLGMLCPPRKDFADFLQEVTTPVGQAYFEKPNQEELGGTAAASGPQTAPASVEEFAKLYRASPGFQRLKAEVDDVCKSAQESALQSADAMRLLASGETFANSAWVSFKLLVKREWALSVRDTAMIGTLFGEALIVGLLMGGVFYNQANVENFATPRGGVGALFFCCAILQRQAWQQIPILIRVRPTFYKQRKRDFFQTIAFLCSFWVVQIPFNVASMCVFCPIVYFMVGFRATANNFFFFLLTMILLQHCLRAIFLAVGAASRSASSAQYTCSLLVVAFLLFSGYILAFNLIPDWYRWFFWINPLAYALRSMVLNEYTSAKYTFTESAFVLSQYGLQSQTGTAYLWAGPILFCGYFFLFTSLSWLLLEYWRFDKVTARAQIKAQGLEEGPAEQERGEQGVLEAEQGGEISKEEAMALFEVENKTFLPVTLAFQNLSYKVFPPNLGKEGLQLLNDVSGVFRPGELVALMGSSGAGKTTLMDCVAGRKTQGELTGRITLNGCEAKASDFSKISGYCEQMDIHTADATVREAFLFSAALRQPQEVPRAEKERFVANVISLLELDVLSDRLIGESTADGLSVEQRKRVTIGVELSANPAVIFCDEPTSGLDSAAALLVMRVLRKIAIAQRTVVSTIHQPSSVIFEMFDKLLLLQRGGHTVYNGPLGHNSSSLIAYFEESGARKILPGENPANYQLEVIGGGIAAASATSPAPETGKQDDQSLMFTDSGNLRGTTGNGAAVETIPESPPLNYADVYAESELKRTIDADVAESVKEPENAAQIKKQLVEFPNKRLRATGVMQQFSECCKKAFTTYHRSPQYNLKRVIVLILIGALFGTAYLFAGPLFPPKTVPAARSLAALTYLSMDFIGILLMVTVLPITFRERTVFYRERAAQMYSPAIYAISLFFVEIPYLIVAIFVFGVITFFLVGFYPPSFGYFLLVFWLYCSLCTYLGQFFAIISPHEIIGQILVGFITVVFNLSSGYLVSSTDITQGLRWIFYVSPASYAFNGIASTLLGNCPTPPNPELLGCEVIPAKDKTVTEYVTETFALQYEDRWTLDVPVLFGFFFAIQIAKAVALQFVTWDTK